MLSVFLANAQYGGGGMWVGRGASMQDGKMLMTLMLPMGSLKMGRHISKLYSGTVGSIPGVVLGQIMSRAEAPAGEVVRIDIDGEQPGVLPATAVASKVLKVRGQW